MLGTLDETRPSRGRGIARSGMPFTRTAQRAWKILALWEETAPKFVKVMPKDYRRMLEALQRAESQGLVGDEAIMAAFEANKNDAARVSGN